MSSLLATKLRLPVIPARRVQLPLLSRRLDEGLASGRRLTLISAPAGFGKTICACEWVASLQMPVAWLSLDAADDDPGRFFTYFIAALQELDKELGREIESVLRAGQLPPAEIITTVLVNNLELDERSVLVVDDLQLIQDDFILQVLEQLLSNLPRTLHLVLVTREDPALPLARLRASNQMTEIRVADLRFSPEEAALFLNEVMSLSLSGADIELLEERTEGWIAGLQLAAIALQAPTAGQSPALERVQAARSEFINTLSGSHRFILNYLTEEVLNRQPEAIREFLLMSSVLDRLSGELCDAVTGRTDSHALLQRLFKANLFLIPLDHEGRWYRYHQLFADLLRDLLSTRRGDDVADLNRRASQWYAQANMAPEAVQHALAAADYALAVNLIESYATDMFLKWHAKTLRGWMSAIPPSWIASSPRINLAFAWMHLSVFEIAEAVPYIERLGIMFPDPRIGPAENASLRAEWLALQAMLSNAQGKPAEALDLANVALEIAPDAEGYVRSQIYLGLAAAYQQIDDYDRSVEAYQVIIQHGRAEADLVSELLGMSGLGLMTLQRGELHFTFEMCSAGIERFERSGLTPPISAAVYGELAQVHFHWAQFEQARNHFLRASQISKLSGYSDAEIYLRVVFSRLAQMKGDLVTAASEIQKAIDLMQVDAPARVRDEVISQQIRLLLAQEQLAAAEAALQGGGFSRQGRYAIPDFDPDYDINRSAILLYLCAMRILLFRGRTRQDKVALEQGIELAGRLIAEEQRRCHIPLLLEIVLTRAQMIRVLGDSQSSLDDYAWALEIAEPEGFITVFVEAGPPVAGALATLLKHDRLGGVARAYVEKILTAFERANPKETARVEHFNLPQPAGSRAGVNDGSLDRAALLTDRELDVLRLMAEGLKYDEIAQRLFISLNTVRSHVKAIYGKLDVNNRTRAIEVARQLDIL